MKIHKRLMKMKKITFVALFFLLMQGRMIFAQENCALFTMTQGDIGISSETFGVSLADFNGDGFLDVVTIDAYDKIEMYFNNGDGSFDTTPLLIGDDQWRFGVEAIDIDNDGDWDFVTSPFSSSANGMEVWENDGNGNFSLASSGLGGSFSSGYEFAVGDMNGDGYSDIFFPHGDISILLNDGNGNFYSNGQDDLYASSPEDVVLADFDSDNDLDAVLVRGGGAGFTGKYYINDGNGQFMDSGQDLSYGCEGVDAGDIDDDGDLDIIIAPFAGSVHFWMNDGIGNFYPGDTLTEVNDLFEDVIVKDYNYDGLVDIFTDNRIWLNDADDPGHFILQDITFNVSTHDFAVGDLNNDNMLDVYIGRFSSSNGDQVYLSDSPAYEYQEMTICAGDSAYLQHAWQTEAGVYLDNAGCMQLMQTTLSFYDAVNVNVTEGEHSLTAEAENASYQWLDCGNDYTPVEGATSQTFSPEFSGSYAVEVTMNTGCADTSACYYVASVGTEKHGRDGLLSIYPNPARDRLHIDAGEQRIQRIAIRDLSGRMIFAQSYSQNNKRLNLSLAHIESGIYLIDIQLDSNNIIHQKLEIK